MNVSETILADYLLMYSGLDKQERLMIKTAIGTNQKDFQTVASFLRQHHPTIQDDELKGKSSGSRGEFPPPPKKKSWKSKPLSSAYRKGHRSKKPWKRSSKLHAYNAQLGSSEEESSSDSEQSDSEDNLTACLCVKCAPDEEYEDIEDAIEQDVLMAFLAADCDICDKAVCEDLAA